MAYSFYVAEIVEASTIDDNRLRIRVLPYMEYLRKNALVGLLFLGMNSIQVKRGNSYG